MVKYSGKVSLRTGQTSGRVYDRFTCKGGYKSSCKSKSIYGTKGKTILCKKHFYKSKLRAEKLGKSTKNFKKGYTSPKSKNQIPTCSKDGCYTISFEDKNNLPYCKFHFQRA